MNALQIGYLAGILPMMLAFGRWATWHSWTDGQVLEEPDYAGGWFDGFFTGIMWPFVLVVVACVKLCQTNFIRQVNRKVFAPPRSTRKKILKTKVQQADEFMDKL